MECPNCSHVNSPEAKFCENCGTALIRSCPVCSSVVPADARFCSNCGANLEPEESASPRSSDLSRYIPDELLSKLRSARAGHSMQGERRTVTMLFADIKGSTAAAERMDPEDWATVVNGAFEHLISPVYRYEGTLAHLQGDAVLAFFGAPMAHEDDPVRAIRAGLEIVDAMSSYSMRVESEWGIPLEVRVGINTGLVVVGEVGSDLRVEYTALGDAINVAARMEQTAEPGTVRVTTTTLALTNGAFEVEDLGRVEVKGKSEPVAAHRIVRFVGRIDGDSDLPLIGRDAELEIFETLRTRLVGRGGWIAAIIGEAGLGKTRLLREVGHIFGTANRVGHSFDDPGEIAWMFGTSRSYDASKPFSTIRDMLARWWRLDDAGVGFVRVEEAVQASGLNDPDAAALLGYIGGVALSEDATAYIDALETASLHAKAGDALTSYLRVLAAERPIVMALEDLHWADHLSLAIVESVMDLTETSPVGLIVALRPYREEPTWRIHEVADRDHHHRYHPLDLMPLGQDESARLVESLFDGDNVGDEIKRRILERSDGNPLFIEEMVRVADEAEDTAEPNIPANLTAMLTARLDRLDEESRFLAQLASVLGVEFDRRTLTALLVGSTTPDRTAELLRRGILVEIGGPSTLGFRHALIREAAYSTILRRTRRELHRRVAEHLIATTPQDAPAIAFHLLEANDLDAAFPYLVEAGTSAARSMALADAIRLLTLAVDNTPIAADPELVERAHEALGEAHALVPDLSQAGAAYQRLYDYGEEEARPSARVAALNHLGYATASIGADFDTATQYLDQARSLAEEIGDELGLAQYHMNACFVASMAGQIERAAAHDEATVDLGEKTGVDSIRLAGLVRRAINYAALLDVEKAGPAIAMGIEASEEAGLEESRAVLVAMGSAILAKARGEIRESVQLGLSAQATLERFSSFYSAMNSVYIGQALYQLGDLEGALSQFANGERLADQLGQVFVAGAAASGMALVYATAGMGESVPDLRDDAHRTLGAPMGEFLASTILADVGFASLESGLPDEAEDELSRGLQASSTSQYIERPRLLAGQTLARIARGDFEAAEPPLEQAWAFVRQRSYQAHDALLHYAQGQLHLAGGRFDESEESLVSSHRLAMDRGQRLITVQVLEARARLSLAAGTDGAPSHVESARAIVTSLAESIADEMLRERFLTTRMTLLQGIETV